MILLGPWHDDYVQDYAASRFKVQVILYEIINKVLKYKLFCMPQASLPISLKTGQESYNITSTLWCFQRRRPSLLGFKYIISYRNYSIFQKKKKKKNLKMNLI